MDEICILKISWSLGKSLGQLNWWEASCVVFRLACSVVKNRFSKFFYLCEQRGQVFSFLSLLVLNVPLWLCYRKCHIYSIPGVIVIAFFLSRFGFFVIVFFSWFVKKEFYIMNIFTKINFAHKISIMYDIKRIFTKSAWLVLFMAGFVYNRYGPH